ncbi:MAG: ribonuclease J [Deferribacteraceae bacterium]|jgi:ribonuclease J|nr:ribonuclease J [Deferribacteraceae bacterium]
MNLYIYETESSAVIVDCGVMFGDEYIPAVDVILPDFTYIQTIRHKLKGLLATHGHEDHIGGISRLLSLIDIPVYTGKFTRELLSIKAKKYIANLNLIIPFNEYDFGDIKTVFFPVRHSIPDTCGVALEIEGKRLVHMSDFASLDIPDFLKEAGIFLLMLDSTNSIRAEEGGVSDEYYHVNTESDVAAVLADIIKNAPGKVFFTTFASNVERLKSVIEASEACGRKTVIVGAAMEKTMGITSRLGLITKLDDRLIGIKPAMEYPPEKLVYILSGCQGEYNSALYSVIKGERKNVMMDGGDTLILSSRVIPGNERWINNIVNKSIKEGITVIQSADRLVHVSGHAAEQELERVILELNPRHFIPIHGEYRHMKACAAIAEQHGSAIHILESGTLLEFSDNGVSRSTFPNNPIFIDNYGEPFEKGVLDELKHISKEGAVIITKRGRRYFAKAVGVMLSKAVINGLCTVLGSLKSGESRILHAKKYIKKKSGHKPLVVEI